MYSILWSLIIYCVAKTSFSTNPLICIDICCCFFFLSSFPFTNDPRIILLEKKKSLKTKDNKPTRVFFKAAQSRQLTQRTEHLHKKDTYLEKELCERVHVVAVSFVIPDSGNQFLPEKKRKRELRLSQWKIPIDQPS